MALSSAILANGIVVREPVGFESGYWVGAPVIFHAADERAWYLTYRIRRPRGVQPDRGGETRIARSSDLKSWEDIWSVTKDKFASASIERCALRKGSDGAWHYFISFVDPADGRWCVSYMKAATPQSLNAATAQPLFKASSLGLEGLKDPWILQHDGVYYMFLSVAVPTARTNAHSHDTLDIFNTGECVSATGLASSNDLANWQWQGVVFKPDAQGWDGYCRRINSVVPLGERFLGFYDGSAGEHENYEERTGLAVSSDLRSWQSLTPNAPRLTSAHGTGSLRYLDADLNGDVACLFYEVVRPDRAHELRLARTSVESLYSALEEIAPGEGTGPTTSCRPGALTRRDNDMLPTYLSVAAEDLGKGTPVKVRILGDMMSLGRDLAENLKAEIVAANRERRGATFIIPVGPVDQYPLLANVLNEQKISCRDVVFIGMDEYLGENDAWLPIDHPLSFRGYLNRMFYDRLDPTVAPLQENRVFPDPEDLSAIPKLIAARGGIDVCYGGIGINGHVAFNEPPQRKAAMSVEAFGALPTRKLDLTCETRTINSVTVGGEISVIPRRAVTVGMREILAARRLRLYCNRPWQSSVARRVLHGPIEAACPASLMRLHSDATLTVADYVAARPEIKLR